MSTALNQFGIDLQAANFNYGVYSDQRAFDEGVRQYDQSFGANRADTAWNQNFQQSQADRDYQQWLAQMGANVGDFTGLQNMGVNPTDQYLASYNQSLLPRTSGGSGISSDDTSNILQTMLGFDNDIDAESYLYGRGLSTAAVNNWLDLYDRRGR